MRRIQSVRAHSHRPFVCWYIASAVLAASASVLEGATDFVADLGEASDPGVVDVAIDEITGIHYVLVTVSTGTKLVTYGSGGETGDDYPSLLLSSSGSPASVVAHNDEVFVGSGQTITHYKRQTGTLEPVQGAGGSYSTGFDITDMAIDRASFSDDSKASIFAVGTGYFTVSRDAINLVSLTSKLGRKAGRDWGPYYRDSFTPSPPRVTAGAGKIYVAATLPPLPNGFSRTELTVIGMGNAVYSDLNTARNRFEQNLPNYPQPVQQGFKYTDATTTYLNYAGTYNSPNVAAGQFPWPLELNIGPTGTDYGAFFVRTTGKIWIPEAGEYTYALLADDLASVEIDSDLVIDQQTYQGGVWQLKTVFLEAGAHDLKVDYYEQTGSDILRLRVRRGQVTTFGNESEWDLVKSTPAASISGIVALNPINGDTSTIVVDGEGFGEIGADPAVYLASFEQDGLTDVAVRGLGGRGAAVRDLCLENGFLYVLQSGEYDVPGDLDVTVKKISPLDLAVRPERAVITATSPTLASLEAASLTPVADGLVLSLRAGSGTLVASDTMQPPRPEISFSGGGGLVVAKMKDDDLSWQAIKDFPQEAGVAVRSAYVEYNSKEGQLGFVGGGATGGGLVINDEAVPPTTVSVGRGFFTQLDDRFSIVQELFLSVRARAEKRDDGRESFYDLPLNQTQGDVRPFYGDAVRGIENRRYTIEMPEHVYQRGDGSLIQQSGLADVALKVAIENDAVTRYTPVGFTVTRGVNEQSVTGTGRSVSVVLTDDTTVTFTFKTEHALAVGSVMDGGVEAPGGDSNAGMPEPAVGKHWVEENELVSTYVNGVYQRPDELGSRYVVTGYAAGGSAGSGGRSAVVGVPQRLQVPQFPMTGPATVLYSWKRQHSLTVGTSSTASEALPVTVVDGGLIDSNGSGVFWFDAGSNVFVGAKDGVGNEGKSMRQVLSAGGVLADMNGLTATQLEVDSPSTEAKGRLIEGLARSGSIVWDYGDKIYRQAVAIGGMVNVRTPGSADDFFPALEQAVLDTIDVRERPKVVSLLEGPAGSTPESMAVWEGNRGMLFPVRPGRFLVEWKTTGVGGGVVLTEVISGFGGDRMLDAFDPQSRFPGARRDYRWLVHEAIPAVTLDPEADDRYAFVSLAFSSQAVTDGVEADGIVAPAVVPQVDDGKMGIAAAAGSLSEASGKHVLVLTRSAAGVAAVGDPAKEEILVRVLETRAWNAGAGWDDGATGMLKDGGDAEIGSKLTDAGYDTAGLGTGFVVHTEARYHGGIYDRSRVGEAGPIIPVNRHFIPDRADGSNPNDLVVIWYERTGENIVFPHQSVVYDAVWPLTVERIVIASRLGSEGRAAGSERMLQEALDPLRYSDVSIYAQDDPELTGYNPNEEHAVVAPSLRFSASANRPAAAFALRDGDLNVTTQATTYTSDPFVLVQFFDAETEEVGMRVYGIDETDVGIPALTVAVGVGEIGFPGDELLVTKAGHGLLDGESVEVRFDDTDVAFPGLVHGGTYFVVRVDANQFKLAAVEGGAVLLGEAATTGLTVIRNHPYVFEYRALAGKPVLPPWPLPQVIGLTRCDETFGRNGLSGTGSGEARAYWEDYKGIPWSVSDGAFRGYFFYPRREDFWFPEAEQRVCVEFLPETSDVTGLVEPKKVVYASEWPADLPVLKVGETLTFAGGEFKADNPSAPGLPGVVGWASGTVVFDSLNAPMDNEEAFGTYAGRLIAPLETRTVGLELSGAQLGAIGPATGITEVDGLVWRFAGLPATLKKRVAFDPVALELSLTGYLNDKTLGDSTLTQTPPPLYVLEPNVLTGREVTVLKTFGANASGDSLTAILGATWGAAVDALYAKGRNPEGLAKGLDTAAESSAYYTGLDYDTQKDGKGNPYRIDRNGVLPAGASAALLPAGYDPKQHPNELVPQKQTGRPMSALGPGLALVLGPGLLEPDNNKGGDHTVYLTLAENDDPEIGGPVTLHIVRIVKKHRYRGAIQTILADNVFSEKTTLRHSGDFGGNLDDLRFEWFYREDDGADVTFDGNVFNVRALKNLVPKWQLLVGESGYSVDVDGRPDLILPDLRFVARYRHKDDVAAPDAAWTGTEWREFGDTDVANGELKGELWAGAANSPTVDGRYRPQLVPGWIKRVLDRVNPYEARFSDFQNNGLPATYVSMIQQFGAGYVGPVALNPDKDVIENVGLIELYQTILERGRSLSIDQRPPVGTPGIYNALQLAATRISDFYMLLGNEAYADAQDPTVGFGSNSAEFGKAAASIWPFMNQTSSPLEEELALLRGVSDSYGRPVFNRLFWNYTKDVGEVAYSLTYNISDENLDGFFNEDDARLRYPQGHGDAWGHYTTALRSQYELLQHAEFQWQPRSEFYNLLDVVVPVDFYDERKFARAAAARAKAGAEIVEQTYRSRYVEDPDGQWQGYTDTDRDRAWGVQGWARRAGQGALFDWVAANALIPEIDRRHVDFDDEDEDGVWDEGEAARFSDRNENGVWDEGEPVFTAAGDSALARVDRSTVSAIGTIPGEYAKIESVYAKANAGRNPLGLAEGSVTFDIDPAAYIGADGIPGVSHFEQIYERAVQATENAMVLFDAASEHQANLRRQQDAADDLFEEAYEQDRDYRNRLIEIFGTPYSGVIGTGKPYPAGYSGPDLFFHMYVDVTDVNKETVPQAPGVDANDGVTSFSEVWYGFRQQVLKLPDFEDAAPLQEIYTNHFFNDVLSAQTRAGQQAALESMASEDLIGGGYLRLDLPIAASGYSFQAPDDWGRRAATGELQSLLSDLVQAQADLALSVGDYSFLIDLMRDTAELLEAQIQTGAVTIQRLTDEKDRINTVNQQITALTITANFLNFLAEQKDDEIDFIFSEGTPDEIIAGFSNGGNFGKIAKVPPFIAARSATMVLAKLPAFGMEQAVVGLESELDAIELKTALAIDTESAKFEVQERLKELEQLFRDEATTRIEVFGNLERMRQLSDAYRTKLTEGLALLDERADFNRFSAGAVQDLRYQDMAFRIFRNDQLASYRAAYELAAQYVYRAAKAYDYETNLDTADPGYVGGVLEDIVRARTIGILEGGEPVLGSGGLADALAKLRDNWGVMGTQLGYNNAQSEGSKISLRHELFRISKDAASDAAWRNKLTEYKVDDLWQVPEFRRYCRPFAAKSAGAQPGLVIPMGTEVVAGKNVFGMPLGGADHAFDPSVFATKVVAAGVWFSGYDTSELAVAPRVYLVPAGMDVMSIPTSADLKLREWHVVDERIPVPHVLSNDASLELANFIPVRDSLNGAMGEIRRFSSFRAYGDTGDTVNEDEMTFDSRLIGRSVWNTRWLLIIPSRHLHGAGSTGVDEFIGDGTDPGVSDINLYFKTFGFSGN